MYLFVIDSDFCYVLFWIKTMCSLRFDHFTLLYND